MKMNLKVKLKKTFNSKQILDKYKRANNQKKAQLKKLIQQSFQQALKHKTIQNHLQIEFKNKKKKTQSIRIQELSTLIISQSDTIVFYEHVF